VQRAIGSTEPIGTLVQVPWLLARPQDWHLPSQAELQQNPCAQKPLSHSAAVEQAAPGPLRPQEFAMQLLGVLHWSSVAQVRKHWLPLQT
jgi:hypothetical protein